MPNVMKYSYLFFAISLFFLIPGIVSLLLWGLRPSVDFTGGSLLEIQLTNPHAETYTQETSGVDPSLYQFESLQKSGDNQYIIRGTELNNDQKDQVIAALNQNWGEVTLLRFESVGPVLGRELLVKTFIAIAIVSAMITFYVWWKFDELKYGVSAVLAMFHDSLILLGSFSLLGHFFHVEVDVLFVTALLTTLSFSVHDTIVVYDRIREKLKKVHGVQFADVVNAAVLETMGRSLNNSITIIVMLLTLVLLGGSTIRWFATALLIGSVTGTYSSTFTAAPLLLLWEELAAKRKAKR